MAPARGWPLSLSSHHCSQDKGPLTRRRDIRLTRLTHIQVDHKVVPGSATVNVKNWGRRVAWRFLLEIADLSPLQHNEPRMATVGDQAARGKRNRLFRHGVPDVSADHVDFARALGDDNVGVAVVG